MAAAKARGVEISILLCTHKHWDHSGGNEAMKKMASLILCGRKHLCRLTMIRLAKYTQRPNAGQRTQTRTVAAELGCAMYYCITYSRAMSSARCTISCPPYRTSVHVASNIIFVPDGVCVPVSTLTPCTKHEFMSGFRFRSRTWKW